MATVRVTTKEHRGWICFEHQEALCYRNVHVAGRLPENVRLLIINHVENFDALDILLYLRREAPRGRTAEQIGSALRISTNAVTRRLDAFASAGFAQADGSPPEWRFAGDPGQTQAVDGLAAWVARDRATVINMVASRNLERMKSLANAFKFGGKS